MSVVLVCGSVYCVIWICKNVPASCIIQGVSLSLLCLWCPISLSVFFSRAKSVGGWEMILQFIHSSLSLSLSLFFIYVSPTLSTLSCCLPFLSLVKNQWSVLGTHSEQSYTTDALNCSNSATQSKYINIKEKDCHLFTTLCSLFIWRIALYGISWSFDNSHQEFFFFFLMSLHCSLNCLKYSIWH